VSGGRLDFGIGAGGSRTAGENPAVREFQAYGVPLVSPGEAVRELDEALRVIRRMWTEPEPFDFDGPTLRLRGAICEPKPVQHHLPIVIGGWGDRALQVVAEHADIWNFPWPSADEFARRSAVLDDHCRRIGRPPEGITRSVQLIVRADDPAEPAASRTLLAGLSDAGATHFVIAPVLGGRPLSWLVDNLIGPVLADR
jgi:alkanesulfonate monooxygenase SsuD/methylene tetrahydromethanopterin reductase-like flavin-dependent oxidoreductase (luciferase family)